MSPRQGRLNKLTESGYQAALAGKPIEQPEEVRGERERVAWENGWRSGHLETEKAAKTVEKVKAAFRNFGFDPKCYAAAGEQWIMVYENRFGRDGAASDRHFVGVFSGETELYRHAHHTDTAARADFERRVEASC